MALPQQFGPYWLLERIGEGAQGDVHLARHVDENSPLVVIKRLAEDRVADDLFIRRFRHEAAVATTVDSENVAKVLDVGHVGPRCYIVMEYIAGQSLARIIRDLRRIGEYTSLTSVADVVCDALLGLDALHTAVDSHGRPLAFVHRDIAPKNLMLSEDGVAKVIDLGLGRSAHRDWKTATGVLMGSPGYMAPEQVAGQEVDHRADIFAMGIVLFELLTLRNFIVGSKLMELVVASTRDNYVRPSSIRADVPSVVDAILRRAVELDPRDRFSTAREFAEALREVLPRRSGRDAQTLMTQMAWQDILETRVRIESLVPPNERFDPVEASRQVVFGQRPSETAVVRVPNQRAVVASPANPSRRWSTAAIALGAMAIFALGWMGRSFFEPSPSPLSPPPRRETPRIVPTAIESPSPRVPVEPEPVTSRKTRRRRRTPRVVAPSKALAPKAILPPEVPAPKARPVVVGTKLERARAVAERARNTPYESRATQLFLELQTNALPGTKRSRSDDTLEQELRVLERALSSR